MMGKVNNVLCTKRFLFVALAISNLLILGLYQGIFTTTYQHLSTQVRLISTHANSVLSYNASAFPAALSVNGSRLLNSTAVRQNGTKGLLSNALEKIRSVASMVILGGAPKSNIGVDVHIEDPAWGHTGEVHHHTALPPWSVNIAIGGGLTTRKVPGLSAATVKKLQFFTTLLPSFCKTSSNGYHYHFYLGYDNNDAFLTQTANLEVFLKETLSFCDSHCPKGSNYSVHFVQCTHSKRPAWAQNDAMFEAYMDGADYYYRVNDDSDMVTKGWTEVYIKHLAEYTPANIGVVGPKHRGGNEAIMTYDFTHRSHLDIFGFYYPRLFTDWWADDWVTKVYIPGRSTKLKNILLTHTMRLGQRYSLVDHKTGGKLAGQLVDDKATLQRYIKYAEAKINGKVPKVDGSRIISMSLYGKDTKYTYGAIRNAQLTPVIYPGWKLRIYVAENNATGSLQVPPRILQKLQALRAEIAIVSSSLKLFPKHWKYLVADDDSVKEFVIRNAEYRLTDRESTAVAKWQSSSKSFHFIKDHPKHSKVTVPEGLWAAKRADLIKALGQSMRSALAAGGDALQSVIWPAVQGSTLCHDSVTCTTNTLCQPFPAAQRTKTTHGLEYIGQEVDAFMDPIGTDASELMSVQDAVKCMVEIK